VGVGQKLKMKLMKSFFKKPLFCLLLILLLASFLRFYKIGQAPPSLNWDEVAIGYNAYSVLKTGRDEWGRKLPLLGFESFGEYKLPVFIYATIPGIWLFGLNEIGVRFMPALFGVLSVLVTYFLAKELFKDQKISLWSAFLMAVSIWDLQLTRAAFEAGLAQLFIALSLLFLLKSRRIWWFLPLSILSASLSVYTYNSSRVFIPLFFSLVFLINPQLFLKNRRGLVLGGIIVLAFALPLLLNFKNPVVQGRYKLISIPADPGFVLRINRARGKLLACGWPPIFARAAHNKATHYLASFLRYYFSHFTSSFLFINGSDHNQQSLPGFGQILHVWALPLVAGFVFLLKKLRKNRRYFPFFFLFFQIIAAPVGTSMTINGNPQALRTLCSLPAWQIIIALGLCSLWGKMGKVKVGLRRFFCFLFIFIFLVNFGFYLRQYYLVYPREFSKDWQYGYKKAVLFMGENKDRYDKLYLTRDYGEPYMFFLFYNKYPPKRYQNMPKVVVDRCGWLMVDHFDKYYFPDFTDDQQSVLEISQREKGKLLFIGIPGDIPKEWVREKIYYLNGEMAFEIGSTD